MQTLIEKIEAIPSPFNDSYILKSAAVDVIRNHTPAPAVCGVDEEGVKTALKEFFANSYQYPEIRARAAWRAIRPYLQPKPSERL